MTVTELLVLVLRVLPGEIRKWANAERNIPGKTRTGSDAPDSTQSLGNGQRLACRRFGDSPYDTKITQRALRTAARRELPGAPIGATGKAGRDEPSLLPQGREGCRHAQRAPGTT